MKSESYLNSRIRRLTNSLQHGWLLLGPNSGPTLGRILHIEFQRVSGVRIPFPPPFSPSVFVDLGESIEIRAPLAVTYPRGNSGRARDQPQPYCPLLRQIAFHAKPHITNLS